MRVVWVLSANRKWINNFPKQSSTGRVTLAAVISTVLLSGAAGSQVKHYIVYKAKLFPQTSNSSEWQLTECVLCNACNLLLLPAALSTAMKRTLSLRMLSLRCPHGPSFKAAGPLKDFRCILKAGVFCSELLHHSKMRTACHRADLYKMFVVTESDKVKTKEGWRNKQNVFRLSLKCPPQRQPCIPSIHTAFIVFIDWRRPRK